MGTTISVNGQQQQQLQQTTRGIAVTTTTTMTRRLTNVNNTISRNLLRHKQNKLDI